MQRIYFVLQSQEFSKGFFPSFPFLRCLAERPIFFTFGFGPCSQFQRTDSFRVNARNFADEFLFVFKFRFLLGEAQPKYAAVSLSEAGS
jgi:hypothetical protein